MRLGYLWLPHLPLQTALLSRPDLADRPVIVADSSPGGGRVVDAAESCRIAGVAPGQALREALELAPTAAVQPAQPERAAALFHRALALLERWSDGLEEDGGEGAWFRPAGSDNERQLGAALVDGLVAALGLKAQVGVASGKFVSRLASRRAGIGGVEVVGDDETASYLAPLPVSLLPLTPSAVDRLRLLGVAAIGQFARLPAAALPRRFGREALPAHRLARGEDGEPLQPRRPAPALRARHDFEPPVADREVLLAAAQAVLERLCLRLREAGQACRTLRLRVLLEDGRRLERGANLRLPTDDPGHALPVLRSLLDALTLDAPVTAVGVDLEALGPPQLVQGTLFDGVQAGGRERVRETLAEVDRRYKGRLRRVVPSETPHSLFEDRRLLLLPYDPGEPPATAPAGDAEPAVRARPVRLHRQRGRCYLAARGWRDEIVAVHNQWEADDWWPEAARRTYYRVRTRGGLVATLAIDHMQGRWLLVERVD